MLLDDWLLNGSVYFSPYEPSFLKMKLVRLGSENDVARPTELEVRKIQVTEVSAQRMWMSDNLNQN